MAQTINLLISGSMPVGAGDDERIFHGKKQEKTEITEGNFFGPSLECEFIIELALDAIAGRC